MKREIVPFNGSPIEPKKPDMREPTQGSLRYDLARSLIGEIVRRRQELVVRKPDSGSIEINKNERSSGTIFKSNPTRIEPTRWELNSIEAKPIQSQPLEALSLSSTDILKADFPSRPLQEKPKMREHFRPARKEDGLFLRTDNSYTLAKNLAEVLARQKPLPSEIITPKGELSLGERTFTITPIPIEKPFELNEEEIFNAPVETQVNLLVNGAAMLEKRKLEPPPLAKEVLQSLDDQKEIILSALDDLATKSGELVSKRLGKTGRNIALTSGLALAAAACGSISEAGSLLTPFEDNEQIAEILPSETQVPAPAPTPTSFTEFGPAATPEAFGNQYPTSLSVDEVREALGFGGQLPEGFMNDLGVQSFIAARESWFDQLGMEDVDVQIITNGETGDDFRWNAKPVTEEGELAGWLQIEDPAIATGWRYAEDPTYDTNFDTSVDQFRFGLPEKLSSENRLEVVFANNEHPVLVELDSEGNPLRWFNYNTQEIQTLEGAQQQEGVVIENGLRYERQEEGKLVETFPGSEIYKTEGGDVVVINRERNIYLAGQTIEGEFGSYTILMHDSLYEGTVSKLENPRFEDESFILDWYPEDWVADPDFREIVLSYAEELTVVGEDNGENISGYPNLTQSPYKEELIRVFSTLIALNEGETSFGNHLETYKPTPKDFIMVMMNPGRAITLADMLPEGVADPNDPGFLVRHTGSDLGYPIVNVSEDQYVSALFLGTQVGDIDYEYLNPIVFYTHYTNYYLRFPFMGLMQTISREKGINLRNANPFFESPFAPLYKNENIRGFLAGMNQEYGPYTPPFTKEQHLQQYQWLKFGTTDLREVDMDDF